MPVVRIKRIYDAPARTDDLRVLVDRVWPRGITKKAAAVEFKASVLKFTGDIVKLGE